MSPPPTATAASTAAAIAAKVVTVGTAATTAVAPRRYWCPPHRPPSAAATAASEKTESHARVAMRRRPRAQKATRAERKKPRAASPCHHRQKHRCFFFVCWGEYETCKPPWGFVQAYLFQKEHRERVLPGMYASLLVKETQREGVCNRLWRQIRLADLPPAAVVVGSRNFAHTKGMP